MSISGQAYTKLAVSVLDKIQTSATDSETGIDTLLRLLGFTNLVTEEQNNNLVFSVLKKKDKSSTSAVDSLKSYLVGLKSRLKKWKRDTNIMQINRITRLLGTQESPQLDIADNDSLDVAAQKIQTFQRNLSEEKDQIGLLTTQEQLYNAAADKVNFLIASLPTTDLGTFGPEIVSLIKADSSFIVETSDKIKRRVRSLNTELDRLNQQNQLIFEGFQLGSLGLLSLLLVAEVMLFLIEKVKYECKECFYFKNNLCTYGGNDLETKSTNSCLQVYNRVDNPFWRPSKDTVGVVKKQFGE